MNIPIFKRPAFWALVSGFVVFLGNTVLSSSFDQLGFIEVLGLLFALLGVGGGTVLAYKDWKK